MFIVVLVKKIPVGSHDSTDSSTYIFDQTKHKINFLQFFNNATVMVPWFMEYCYGSVRYFSQFQFYLSRLAIPRSI